MGAGVRPERGPFDDLIPAKKPADPFRDLIPAAAAEGAPRPGLLARTGAQLAGFGRGLVEHPGETLASFVTAPLASLRDAVLAEPEGEESEASVGYAGNRGGPPALPRRVGQPNRDASITPQRQREASVQTLANVALPGIAGRVATGASALGAGQGLSRFLALQAAGATGGAAYAPDDPLAGALSGAVLAPAVGGLAKSAGATASALLRPAETGPLVRVGPVKFGPEVEGKVPRKARAEIAERRAQDLVVGAKPNVPAHRSLPAMALDEHGPAVQGYAEGIANRPGEGGSILRGAVERRQARMRPALTKELERGTGVKRGSGLDPMRDEIAAGREEMGRLYDEARAKSEGVAVESPTLNRVLGTPVGQAAYDWATMQKANRMRELPRKGAADAAEVTFGEGDEALTIERPSNGLGALDAPEVRTLPDPETLHYMKQYLANAARMGVRDGQGGKVAVQAQGALGDWAMIRGELPEAWQKADAAAAAHFRRLDAMNEGRNIYRTSDNPAGRPKAAVEKSLDAVEKRQAKAPAPEKKARQVGAAIAAHQRLEGAPFATKSPGRVFARSPERVRQTSMAFKTPEAAQDFRAAVAAWDAAQAQGERLLGGSATARRGAQGSGAGAIKPTSLLDGPKALARKLVEKVVGQRSLKNQQAVEAEVAKMLTSRSARLLPAETRASAIAARIREMAAQGAGRLLAPANEDRR